MSSVLPASRTFHPPMPRLFTSMSVILFVSACNKDSPATEALGRHASERIEGPSRQDSRDALEAVPPSVVASKGAVAGGRPQGLWKYYRRDGTLVLVGTHDGEGRLSGPWIAIERSGSIIIGPTRRSVCDGWSWEVFDLVASEWNAEWRGQAHAPDYADIPTMANGWAGSGCYYEGQLVHLLGNADAVGALQFLGVR
jgi:hypothetical protein